MNVHIPIHQHHYHLLIYRWKVVALHRLVICHYVKIKYQVSFLLFVFTYKVLSIFIITQLKPLIMHKSFLSILIVYTQFLLFFFQSISISFYIYIVYILNVQNALVYQLPLKKKKKIIFLSFLCVTFINFIWFDMINILHDHTYRLFIEILCTNKCFQSFCYLRSFAIKTKSIHET